MFKPLKSPAKLPLILGFSTACFLLPAPEYLFRGSRRCFVLWMPQEHLWNPGILGWGSSEPFSPSNIKQVWCPAPPKPFELHRVLQVP